MASFGFVWGYSPLVTTHPRSLNARVGNKHLIVLWGATVVGN